MVGERIRVFSNGDAYRTWRHNNCSTCAKAPDCPLEYALVSACVLDGTIAPDIARRLGVPADGSERWWCREHQAEPAPDQQQQSDEPAWPPARIEGEPIALPGFDVPERPAERGPWTA
jgi:hypothetical protein